ncbi:MAG: DUF4290 domain-containing protein [Bacteroidales bacterium]|jgi:hypothetical protein|nr:DUF4290 domain-containing protein [Bacteroidales bacterium]
MEYNTSQKKLILPEYGRHVHMMVQYAAQLKDRDERNAAAHSIIGVMGTLQPHLRDIPDFKHKLWDHLYVMSNFKLDIDSPYPMPAAEELVDRPDIVPYPQVHIGRKHYGKILVEMIREASKLEDAEQQKALVQLIANQMKKTYLAWNRSEVSNDQIMQDIWDISDGKIKMEASSIRFFENLDMIAAPAAALSPASRNNPKSKKKRIIIRK